MEGAQAQENPEAKADTAVATKIDIFIQPNPSDLGEGSSGDSFGFSVQQKTAPAIDPNLAEIVKSLLLEELLKDKLAKVQSKYLRAWKLHQRGGS